MTINHEIARLLREMDYAGAINLNDQSVPHLVRDFAIFGDENNLLAIDATIDFIRELMDEAALKAESFAIFANRIEVKP